MSSYLSFFLSFLSILLSFYLSIYLSVCLSIYMQMYTYTCVPVYRGQVSLEAQLAVQWVTVSGSLCTYIDTYICIQIMSMKTQKPTAAEAIKLEYDCPPTPKPRKEGKPA